MLLVIIFFIFSHVRKKRRSGERKTRSNLTGAFIAPEKYRPNPPEGFPAPEKHRSNPLEGFPAPEKYRPNLTKSANMLRHMYLNRQNSF